MATTDAHGPREWGPLTDPAGIQVAGLGPAGGALAAALAAGAVAALALWDPTPVGASDLGLGLLPADLGRPRDRAWEARLSRAWPALPVYAGADTRPGALGAATVAVDLPGLPDLAARAVAAQHPLLPVRTDVRGVSAGPWTGGGAPGCVLCTEDVPGTALTAPPAAPPRREPGAAREPGHALRAVVLALDVLTGRRDATSAVLRVDAATGRLTRIPVRARPGCGCADLLAGDGTGDDWAAALAAVEESLDGALADARP
ncbi:ThiF family adenylyltransferase [Micrococcus porci]|uniref:ThiF family adenylyltransferase n=1 Tax=Micrococcus porci TaxID=2856555 RepID=UPI003CF60EC6